MSDSAVLDSLDRTLPPLNQETRVRLYREDLSRIDDLLLAFYPAAKQGNTACASVCLRLLERRALMTGSDSPKRVDIVVEQTPPAERPGSTEALLRALNEIAAERSVPTIEHEPSPAA